MKKYKQILIVGRDTNFINELTNYLLAAGYNNIESFDSYQSAITRLKQNSFDIVLMDIFTPEMKELKYAHKIRSLKPKINIFLMIEPEHQEMINKGILREDKFKCVFKLYIKECLLESFQ